MTNRIRRLDQLSAVVSLTPAEISSVRNAEGRLSMAIPPYWAALMDANDPNCPLRRQAIPVVQEFEPSPNDHVDPLAEDSHMPVPGLIHRYPDRAVLLVTQICAMYCRFCTRSRIVAKPGSVSPGHLAAALTYLQQHTEIRDVLISGGDPLSLADSVLDRILSSVAAIPHVEFIRVNTRTPVTLPYRVTTALCEILRRHRVWVSLHFNHPKEITPAVKVACDLMSDGGIPLSSQSVLLKGINDDSLTLKALFHQLLKLRVRPYYLYQCDPVKGSAHFRTPIDTGVAVITQLRGHTTGHAVPTFVVDAPNGGGKIALSRNPIVSREPGVIWLRNHFDQVYAYREENSALLESKPVVSQEGP